jgi:hypothetical protein
VTVEVLGWKCEISEVITLEARVPYLTSRCKPQSRHFQNEEKSGSVLAVFKICAASQALKQPSRHSVGMRNAVYQTRARGGTET